MDRSVVDEVSKGTLPTSKKQAKMEQTKLKKQDLKAEGKSILRMSSKYQHLLFLGTLKPETDKEPTCPLLAVEVKPEGKLSEYIVVRETLQDKTVKPNGK